MSTLSPLPAGMNEAGALTARRTISLDYSFHFDLEGESGNSHTQAISVSIEAAFTAVSIGYGVVPKIEDTQFGLELLADLDAGSTPPPPTSARTVLPRVPLVN